MKQLATKESIRPSPDESKDLQVPSGLSMPSFMNCTEVLGLRSRLTPPTRAASQWPWRMAWNAFSKANKLEEQAVSMEVLGPAEAGKDKQKVQGRGGEARGIENMLNKQNEKVHTEYICIFMNLIFQYVDQN